jgi:8-oxo-dGTP pyrophosphatase MutT (NUDIX family)
LISSSAIEGFSPVREVWVAQALIKTRICGKADPVYLVQRDEDCPQEYRLIGGRLEPGDSGLLETMQREMMEELGLELVKDYTLHEFVHELPMFSRVSPTYGVLSNYHYRIYGVTMTREVCLEGGDNKWVTKRELLAGYADSGERIAAWHTPAIDEQLPDGLDGMSRSFSEEGGRLRCMDMSIQEGGQKLCVCSWECC